MAPETTGRKGAPKTLDQVAAATGYSRTTVRFVVTGQAEKHRIRPETRALIEDYVARHGLVVDHTARALKTRRSDAVGLVVPDLANAFFARLTAELEERCRASGRVLLTASSHEDAEREAQAVAGLLWRGVDGLVIAPCRAPEALRPALRGRRTAVVSVDRAYSDAPWPTVVGDNEAAAETLAGRLLAIAGGSIAFVGACPALPSVAGRIAGFRAAARAAALDRSETRLHLAERDEASEGARLMRAAITAHGAPKAVMCTSLLMLEGVFRALIDAFGRVPEDLVVGTFDHHPFLDAVPNRILAVRQDERGLAEAAFAHLIAQMDGGPREPIRVVVPGRLVDRPGPGVTAGSP
ncbi:MAG: substrate-binding domain-containing protein [Hyphomicrobiales bacterium]|nr:substrate-binding domain-containing protein [Hyphomicrobiales bacterium]